MLVVGDVMLDKYIWGKVGRISPEAPVPVVQTAEQRHQPGGAANVAMNLAMLGARTDVVGFVGSDEDGALLTKCMAERGIVSHCIVSSEFPTITKLRILGGRQQMLRLDTERLGARPATEEESLLAAALKIVPESDAIILSDYAKGALSGTVCQAIICAARKRGIPVLVDPKSQDFSRYRGATTICPNISELSRATHLDEADLPALLDAAEKMVADIGFDFLTATLSENGIALLRTGKRFMAPAVVRKVFDVSGAGDTVIALMALCLAAGLQPEIAVELANLAAGVVVGKVGTMPIERHEILAALNPQIALNTHDKIVTRDELLIRIALWRQNGDRIVFTNGCFDLLHVGHIAVIEHARHFGDRLIVAVNSDASVARLKGPSRPLVGQFERAKVLAALGAVDAVILFDEDTPLPIILESRPDVIVKGGDYTPESVVGAQQVQMWGGAVRIVPMVDGFSTTRLLEKALGVRTQAKVRE